ncbi:MAG: aspartyl protease family protein [Phycisphaerales bacterium]|nr:MAG: aspartyl protease family protein [Phycisphaerales bacterium]
MRNNLVLLLSLMPIAAACASAAQETDPEHMMDVLREQMNRLHSIRARYTIDSEYGPERRRVKCSVSYLKSGPKYNILESFALPGGRTKQIRYVHDGIQLKQYIFDPGLRPPRHGAIYDRSLHTDLANHNDLLRFAHFFLARNYQRLDPNDRTFKYLGAESIDARPCEKILMITPYLPGHRAFNYHWIDRGESGCILRKVTCLIDDDPNSLLYARTYTYGKSPRYPFPRRIRYERYNIDDGGNRILYFKKNISVESLQINALIDPAEFNFTFPQGTVVNVSPLVLDADGSTEPNRPAPHEPRTPDTRDQNEPVNLAAEFQIPREPTPVLLPVNFHNQSLLFLLDTGCTNTVLDVSLKERLGAPKKFVRAQTAGNPVITQLFEAPDARLGPFSLRTTGLAAVADLKMPGLILGKKISGIVGINFLKHHILQIDFDSGRLALLPPSTAPEPRWGRPLPISFDSLGLPRITATVLENIPVEFVIDTGLNATGAIENETFDKIIAERELKTVPILAATAGGSATGREARIPSLAVGPFEYRDLIISDGSVNHLGLDFLARHQVTLDFPNSTVYLKKSKGFNRIDESDMTGLHLLRIEGRTVVYSLDAGSPAQKVGLNAGDVILEFNGHDANALETWQIENLKRSGHGKRLMLTIERVEKTREISLFLQKRI